MTINNVSNCPECGGTLKYYDNVGRIVRTKGGRKRRIKVKRFRCQECNKLHRLLPSFIFPYKQYHGLIIKRVLQGVITPNALGYEDYPCEMTIKRWTQKIHTPL